MANAIKKSNVSIDRVLKPQTRLDLIFDVDLINDFIDVRSSVVFNVAENAIIVSQADPPVLKSMVGRSLEATFVSRDLVTSEIMRWGWRCQILNFIADYKLREDDSKTVQALGLSRPAIGALTETNARMDYRLSIGVDRKISIQTHPSFGRVSLLDFSAGGVLISVPKPVQAKLGMRLWFTLFFPLPSASGQKTTTINGEAEVVRVTSAPEESHGRLGLKFMDLDLNSTRALQKAINFYMLEEQRNRSRDVL